jgi:hypothetical protein
MVGKLTGGQAMPADSIDGKRVSKQAFMDRSGISAGMQRRIAELEAKAAAEMARRVRAEQSAAGLRSAIKRYQAALLQKKADEAKQRARTFDAELAP